MTHGPTRPMFIAVGITLVVILLAAIVWWLWPMDFMFGGGASIADMAGKIRSWGPWAVLGSIALMFIHSFLPFPAELIAIANGIVFGPFWGSVITWVGAMLGAISTFALVRLLGRPFVQRMLTENQFSRLSQWSSTQGGGALLISRLIPLIAFNLLNYAAALTQISWWTFIWATGLGILPLTIAFNVFGASVLAAMTWNWAWILLGALLIVGWILIKRRSRAAMSDDR